MIKEKIFLFLFLIVIIISFIIFVAPYSLSPHPILIGGDFKQERQYPPYIKGIYLNSWTANSSAKINHFIELINKTELNAVIIDIKEVDGIIAIDNIISNTKELIDKLHQNNIYAIARIVVFKDDALTKIKPELALKNRSGGLWRDFRGMTWLDPASKEVWDYHVEIAKEAIKIGFDEINFDYVRFPSDGDISKIVYPIWDGNTPKSEIIKQFFTYLNKELKPTGAFLSVDLFGLTLWRENGDDMNIGQILENAMPYFDYICPMVYPSHYPSGFENYNNPADHPYEIIKINLEKGQERVANSNAMPAGRQAKLRPWLQDFDMGAIYDAKMINLEKQAVYDTNSYGWLMWNAASNYTEDALERY